MSRVRLHTSTCLRCCSVAEVRFFFDYIARERVALVTVRLSVDPCAYCVLLYALHELSPQ